MSTSVSTRYRRSLHTHTHHTHHTPHTTLTHTQLAPAYEGTELGIGDSILVKAIAGATGRSVQKIKSDVVKKGDLGLVAEVDTVLIHKMFRLPICSPLWCFSSYCD